MNVCLYILAQYFEALFCFVSSCNSGGIWIGFFNLTAVLPDIAICCYLLDFCSRSFGVINFTLATLQFGFFFKVSKNCLNRFLPKFLAPWFIYFCLFVAFDVDLLRFKNYFFQTFWQHCSKKSKSSEFQLKYEFHMQSLELKKFINRPCLSLLHKWTAKWYKFMLLMNIDLLVCS